MTTPSRSISPEVFSTPRGRGLELDVFSTPGTFNPGAGGFPSSSESFDFRRATTPDTPTRPQAGSSAVQEVDALRFQNVSKNWIISWRTSPIN